MRPGAGLVRPMLLALAIYALVTAGLMLRGPLGVETWLLGAFRDPADPGRLIGPRQLLQAVRDLTALGGTFVVTLAMLAVAAWLAGGGRGRLALQLLCSAAGAQGASWGMKHLISRPRPDVVPHLVDGWGAAYPSGHSLMAAATWITLAGLAVLLTRPAPLRRALLIGGAALLVGGIGISRICLGVHWPGDVLGGWAFGSFWAFGTLILAARLLARGG